MQSITDKVKRPRVSAMAISIRLLTVAAFLVLFGSFPTFAADYSDSWEYDANPNAAYDEDDASPRTTYVVGAGVTENDYTSEGDAIGVETTVTSPSGITQRVGASGDFSAYAEADFPWDWDFPDVGDWLVQTTHQPLCWGNWDGSLLYERRSGGTTYWYYNPDYSRCSERRTTSFVARRTFSVHSYRRTLSSGEYVPTCYALCTRDRWTPVGVTTLYAECYAIHTPGTGCSAGFCKNLRTRQGRWYDRSARN